MMETLTTIIPVYNGEKYITATLESVAAQARRPDRLIVLDNCSTDSTRKIASEFKKIHCELIQNPSNLGLFGNLNRALEFADQTTFLHLLHADDLILPKFYETSAQALKVSSNRGLVYSLPELVDDTGQRFLSGQLRSRSTSRSLPPHRFIAERAELRPIYFVGVLLKTDSQPCPCKFREDMPQIADHVFWAEWARHCSQVIQLPETLTQYRFHTEAGTARNINQLEPWVVDEWRAMQAIAALLDEGSLRKQIRRQKLKALFAARSLVKASQVQSSSPELAAKIRAAARHVAGSLGYAAAGTAVRLRNFVSL